MKQRILIALLLSLSLLLLMSACKKDPLAEAPDVSVPEDFDETAENNVFGEIVSQVSVLSSYEDNNYVRSATTPDAFLTLLQSDEKDSVRLSLKGENNITIPNIDLIDKTVILDAPETAVTAEGTLGTVIVNSLGTEGLTIKEGIDVLAVCGEGVTVNIDGGAAMVFVQGKNCTLHLNSGYYGEIYCVNQTVVIENNTERAVSLRMANGAVQLLGSGETLDFQQD